MYALLTESFHPDLSLGLKKLDFQVDEILCDNVSIKEIIGKYTVLVVNSGIRVDEDLLQKATKLRIVLRVGSGMEHIDIQACQLRGIEVYSSRGGNANAVAEHVFGMILMSAHQIHLAQNDMIAGKWVRENHRGIEISDKTLGIIGLGKVGSRLAQIALGFGMKVYGYDIDTSILIEGVHHIEDQEIFRHADIISFHVPLTEKTYHLISKTNLQALKSEAWLVNTARGGIMNLEDTLSWLLTNPKARAFLDVFPVEPYQTSDIVKDLVKKNQLILTPHIAGWSQESHKQNSLILLDFMRNFKKTL
ncbi:MAG: hypothetical protein MUE53_02795 [Chitinophagales bacterium]|jgi:D-3-phosphoglycerate dehydrogenase|nr:hypothetical protein [Chitinophagales bacterium]